MLFPIKDRVKLPRIINSTFSHAPVGAEIGVQRGLYSEHLLHHVTWSKFYCIDPWEHLPDYKDTANVGNEEHENRYQATVQRLSKFGDKVVFLRKLSIQAAEDIPDDHLDFIYIDGNHDYEYVYNDLVTYWPKLREGAIVAGHDYVNNSKGRSIFAVKAAVDRFCAEYNITEILSTPERWPTWVFEKPRS